MEDEAHLPKSPPATGGNTRIPTNREIWAKVSELSASILTLSGDLKKVENRMTTYEKSLEATTSTLQTNTGILKAQSETLDEIKKLVPFITGLITVLKWCAGLMTTILGGLIIALIVHFFL